MTPTSYGGFLIDRGTTPVIPNNPTRKRIRPFDDLRQRRLHRCHHHLVGSMGLEPRPRLCEGAASAAKNRACAVEAFVRKAQA